MLQQLDFGCEMLSGASPLLEFTLTDVCAALPALTEQYRGQVQTIYLDPPFSTGESFVMRQKAGERDWQRGVGSVTVPTYADRMDREEYLAFMRTVLEGCRDMLRDTGCIFLHIDYRMHAHLRLLMDEIFGEDNFLNEIVWSYQTGGRAKAFFSRKHDIILFYAKTKDYYFDISSVPVSRTQERHNHMRRHVDADGRIYRSVTVNGKVYTYYDDEPAYPSDVWSDVSHLQQRDPQRTGYDTQKPLALIERIVSCSSQKGDIVMDLFAGSGTAMEAAARLGRRFVGTDSSVMSYVCARRRLGDAHARFHLPRFEGETQVEASVLAGIAYTDVTLESFACDRPIETDCGEEALLDAWGVGILRGDTFECMAFSQRSKDHPALEKTLQLPVYEGKRALITRDIFGRVFLWALPEDEND